MCKLIQNAGFSSEREFAGSIYHSSTLLLNFRRLSDAIYATMITLCMRCRYIQTYRIV